MFIKCIESFQKTIRMNYRGFSLFNPTLSLTRNARGTQSNFFKHLSFVTRNVRDKTSRSFTNNLLHCNKTFCYVSCKNLPKRCLTSSSWGKLENTSAVLKATSMDIVPYKTQHTVPDRQERGYKVYPESENALLYEIISEIPELQSTLAPIFKNVDTKSYLSDSEFQTLLKTDFSNCEKEEILDSFTRISFYMHDKEDTLSHKSLDNLCESVVKSIPHMSDDELCKLMYLLQIWSPKCFRTDRNYFNIFSQVDKVQLERLQGQNYYSLQQLLLLIDYWANLNLLRSSNFCKLGLKKLLNKSHQLLPKEFVQVMYYHCRYRTFHPLANSYDIEFNFEKIYSELSPNEIAIVLLAFFKSEKKFTNPHLSVKNARTFINKVEQMNPVCINGFLKSMKHHFPLHEWNVLYQVCDKVLKIIDSVPHQILPHAALVGTKIDVYHPALIDKLVEKTIQNCDILRIKDFEKVLFPISLFNHKLKQPEFFDIVSKEFLSEKRKKEVDKYPKTLISLVHHLIIANHFNFQLIETCLDIDFLHNAFGKKLSGYVVPKDLLLIDFSLEIEAPDYTGTRLPESLRDILCKHYAWRKPGDLFHHKVVKADEFVIQVQTKLEQMLGGEKFVQLAYVLPHFVKPDVLVCLKDGKPVPIPESMSDFVHMTPYPPPATGTWYAFIFITFHRLVRIDDAPYKGPVECKIRQLKRLGYEPIVMAAFEWLDETEQVRDQILLKKLGLSASDNSDTVSAKQ